jgi:hypothetical protein
MADDDAENLLKAVEAAGFVHPSPAVTPPTVNANASAHLDAIAQLAIDALSASPAGIETISQQINAHVEALRAGT